MTAAHRPSDDHRIDSLHHLREIIPILTQHVSPLAFISSHKKDPAALAQKIHTLLQRAIIIVCIMVHHMWIFPP